MLFAGCIETKSTTLTKGLLESFGLDTVPAFGAGVRLRHSTNGVPLEEVFLDLLDITI